MNTKSKADETLSSGVEIIDVTENPKYERFLYWCILHYGGTFRRYEPRCGYLASSIPKGFCKKILFFKGDYAGTIEYAPAEVSGYPIKGEGVIVMNCIWIHAKAKRRGFGKLLLKTMMDEEKDFSGFATIGLENHWKRWFKKEQMEGLGFKSIRSIELEHKIRHQGQRFKMHLMWMPVKEGAAPPIWDETKLLEGTYFCFGHPLDRGWYGCDNMGEVYER